MKIHVVYATSNPGKIIEIRRHFGFHGIPVSSLSDFVSAELDPEESGTTLGDNALIKAMAYADVLAKDPSLRGTRFVVIADDTGVEIAGLNGEPGIKVRRWIGRKMTDEEIISYTLERMQGLDGAARKAQFRTVLCMLMVDENGNVGEPAYTEGTLAGVIIEGADPIRIAGFPFESLFYVTEYDMLLGALHRLSDDEKRLGKFNHRERAIEKAVPVIKSKM